MKPYIFVIPANTEYEEHFGKGANYIRLDESATVSVTVRSDENDEEYTLKSGDDVILSEFESLLVRHDGSSTTSFTLYIGRGTKASASRIGGSVQVTGGSNNTASPPFVNTRVRDAENGDRFVQRDSVAWPEFSLRNPAGSGYDIFLWGIWCSSVSSSSGVVTIGESTTEAGTNAGRQPMNRLLGGRGSIAVFQYSATSGAIIFTGNVYDVGFDGASEAQLYDPLMGGPIVIREGVILGVKTTGSPFIIFDYEEVPK